MEEGSDVLGSEFAWPDELLQRIYAKRHSKRREVLLENKMSGNM